MLIDFRTLFPKYGIRPTGVLHVGGNIGEEAPIYLQLGIKRQIWIEANPDIYKKLKQNISGNPDATALNYCVGDEDDKDVIFHVSNNGSQSSSVLELGTHLIEHPDVHYVDHLPMKTVRLDSIFSESDLENYDFLNCDLQGFDLNAIKGLGELFNNFKWVYVEVNKSYVYKNCALLPEVEEYFSKFGLKKRELKFPPNKTWGDCLFTKKSQYETL